MIRTSKPGWAERIRSLARDTRGQDLIEYALLLMALAVACGATLPPVSESIKLMFSKVMAPFSRVS